MARYTTPSATASRMTKPVFGATSRAAQVRLKALEEAKGKGSAGPFKVATPAKRITSFPAETTFKVRREAEQQLEDDAGKIRRGR